MHKIVLIDDYVENSEAGASILRRAGYDVLALATEFGPLDFDQLIAFDPKVLVLALYKRRIAFGRPVRDPHDDVLGFSILQQMEAYPAINVLPIILTGSCLNEDDLPTSVNYDLFLALPDDVKLLVPKAEELATKVKTRRRISELLCPLCRSRLTYLTRPDSLFCPRCAAAVSVIDDEHCHAINGKGDTIPCTVEMLRAPRRP